MAQDRRQLMSRRGGTRQVRSLGLVLTFLVVGSLAVAAASPLVVSAAAQDAARRVALVVGNGAYERPEDALANPSNDAVAMASKLRALDFEVIEAIDRDYRGMRRALSEFDRALQGASTGLFFYAGHGMEYQGRNYLFPTDAVLETEGDVGLNLIDIEQVMQVMETTVSTRLLFLDACRNNPLARRFRSGLGAVRSTSVGSGLARMDAAVGTFVAYATAPGTVAEDGRGANSPFTTALLTHLNEPGLEVGQLMRRVRDSVLAATDDRQVPWDSSSLRGAPVVLNPGASTVVDEPATPAQAEIVYWESIKDEGSAPAFRAYLDRFGGDGLFADLARMRLDALVPESEAASLVPDPVAPPPGPEDIEQEIGIDRAAWRDIQRALTAFGHDAGPVDGIPGRSTRDAVAKWQGREGERATGFLTEPQVASLLAVPPEPKSSGAGPSQQGDTGRSNGTAPASRFEVAEDVIIDRATGLMWARAGFVTSRGTYAWNWSDAVDWVEQQNAIRFLGHSDWVLPSITEYRELYRSGPRQSLFDEGEYAYWSRNQPKEKTASYISFDEGFAVSGSKIGHTLYVKGERTRTPFSALMVRATNK